MTKFIGSFPKKSRSRRRKIFVQRARKTIRPVVRSFYDKTGANIDSGEIDLLTKQIVAEIVDMVTSTETFGTTILRPDIKDQEALMESLYTAAREAGDAGETVRFSKKAVEEALNRIATLQRQRSTRPAKDHAVRKAGGTPKATAESTRDAEKAGA